MNYYREALGMLYEYAETISYDGDSADLDANYDELMDAALDIAVLLVSWGVSDDYAFYLASRRVVGSI